MKYLWIIFLCFLNLSAFAETEFNTTEAEQIIQSISNSETKLALTSKTDTLIEKVRKLNPNIAEEIEKKANSDDEKISMMRSYLAHETFEYYKTKFISDLKQRSKETGRKIETDSLKKNGYVLEDRKTYYLNRGKLDTDKCKKDGWVICDYPNGFEEYTLDILEEKILYSKKEEQKGQSQIYKSLILMKDNSIENYHLYCNLTIKYSSTSSEEDSNYYSFNEDVHLDIYCNTGKYDEQMKWRNQLVADTRAGKYDITYIEKLPEGSPFGDYLYHTQNNKNPEKWESNKLPSSYSQGVSSTYTNTTTKTSNQ